MVDLGQGLLCVLMTRVNIAFRSAQPPKLVSLAYKFSPTSFIMNDED